ncbi:MAG: phosphotriesterase [Gammaproteobacteria bacterium]|nr:phosphotriesterase [Gammaproteobacteria bacterium]
MMTLFTRIAAGSLAAILASLAVPADAASAQSTGTLVGRVMTVNGPISPEALGMTLPHEHLFMDFHPPLDTPDGWRAVGASRPVTSDDIAFFEAPLTMDKLGLVKMGRANRDNRRLDDEDMEIREITDFRLSGGGTLVEVSSIGLGRNPAAIKRVADATGVNIVMGSGWYEQGYVLDAIDKRSVADLADEMVRDITVGVDGTGIRAGIIGEIGIKDLSRAYDRKIIAAAGRASLLSGAPLSIHMGAGSRDQLGVLQLLKDAGVDLSRVAMGHSDSLVTDMSLMKQILDQGAFIEFDLLGRAPTVRSTFTDHDVAVAIVALLKQGYGRQILLSQDVCSKLDLKSYGGGGYSFINEQFIPYLRRMGVTRDQIAQMVIDNPRRLLTFVAPRPLGNQG